MEQGRICLVFIGMPVSWQIERIGMRVFKQLWVLFLCGCWMQALAQKSDPKEYKQLIVSADKHAQQGEFQEAHQLYSLAWNTKKSNELAMKITRCFFSIDKEIKAIPYLEYVHRSGFKSLELARLSGISYHRAYRFEEALTWLLLYEKNAKVEAHRQEAKQLILYVKNAQALIPVDRPALKLRNLGPAVNSTYDDYSPVLTADERDLFFTSRRHNSMGAERDENGVFYEDIYFSKQIDSVWSDAENAGGIINTDQHDATAGISPNGDELFIYRAENGGDILVSKWSRLKWTEPISMGDKINSPGWETSISTTPNERYVFFSSNRDGGKGGKDIYLAQLLQNGKWSDPILLNDQINTPYDEESPFIHPDGKTLYFSSKGHNSIGGYDIFRCELDISTGNLLSPVKNLGFPISDVGDDVFFVWSADNRRAYFSSDRDGGYGLKDIYVAELDYHLQPEIKVVSIKASEHNRNTSIVSTCSILDLKTKEIQELKDQRSASFVFKRGHEYELTVVAEGYCESRKKIWTDTLQENLQMNLKPKLRKVLFTVSDGDSKPLKARIRVIDPLQGDVFDLDENDSRDGKYNLVLKEGVKYSIEVIQKGYWMRNTELEIPSSECEGTGDSTQTLVNADFRLRSIEKGQQNELENLYFASGKVTPLPDSEYQLKFFLRFLQINPSLRAEVRAHTDEVGGAEFNLQLSQKRADIIVKYLIENGIAPERLIAKGMGESQPLAKGNDQNDLRRNRRVEFIILEE